jgi:hypothetical protein
MPSTYTTNGGIELPANGEQSGTWGSTVNDNMNIVDRLTNGVGVISLSGTTHTLTTADGTPSDGHYSVLVLGGAPSGTNTITIAPNDGQHVYIVKNSSGQSAIFSQGSGANVTVLNGKSVIIYSDGAGAGAAVVDITSTFQFGAVDIDGGTIDGTVIGGAVPAAGTFTTLAGDTVAATTSVAVGASTVDATELGFLENAIAGTIVNSKAVIYSAAGQVNATSLALSGTALTASAVELNYVDGVTSAIQTQIDAVVSTKAAAATVITAGTGLTGGGDLSANRTLSHADTSSQDSVNNTGSTVIQDVTLDEFGHVTALTSTTITTPAQGMPNYGNGVSVAYDTQVQAPSDGVYIAIFSGSFINGIAFYAGSSSANINVGVFFDDINSNTKGQTFVLPVKSGTYFKAQQYGSWGYESIAIIMKS